ncbi:hypothetical protein GUITHDRAFT_108857 [Guillardia theta CCMP2712]|uniref:Uncharacterized protein n=1 Tax=Guillardia theta (strain CCMP2712) TaxID=905079 RepID=L1J9K9_GUITC|nr:hypothetical protein GUITHDRAFT_108857 [Guillardia theta CCMP2712]EKX45216.1 hypothetical protein GUITHDRAFT_108857 [Guillardia theta CCMP2712]|eukprot:XP_005832196.1 hypothetical protein GUITHDRAFT_108857 [Guillardia theta CCMP2712]
MYATGAPFGSITQQMYTSGTQMSYTNYPIVNSGNPIQEAEVGAPGTPLTFELCERLGLPQGTLWGNNASATMAAPAPTATGFLLPGKVA